MKGREVKGFMKGVVAIVLAIALMVFVEGNFTNAIAAEEAAGAAGASAGTATSAGITTGTIVAGAVIAAAAVAVVASGGGGGSAVAAQTPHNEAAQGLADLAAANPDLANAVAALGGLDAGQIAAVGDMLANMPDAATANAVGQAIAVLGADAQTAFNKGDFTTYLNALPNGLGAKIRAALQGLTPAQLNILATVLTKVDSATLAALKTLGAQMKDNPDKFKEGALQYGGGSLPPVPPIGHVEPPVLHVTPTHH